MSNRIENVEIFGVGTWHGGGMRRPMHFTSEFISDVVKNTSKIMEAQKFPLKLGHSEKQALAQSDGQPSLGWLENVRQKGEKMIADLVNVPDIMMKAIKKGLYKQVSVELGKTEGVGTHVKGLAILGADLPAVKTLKDLSAYFTDGEEYDDVLPALCFTEPEIIEEIEMNEDKNFELEKRIFELEQREKEIAAKEAELQSKAIEAEFSAARTDVLDTFKRQVEAGELAPFAIAAIEKDLDSQKLNFSAEAGVSLSIETVQELGKAYRESITKDEVVTQEPADKVEFSSVDEEVEFKIAEVMKTSGRSYGEASDLVFSDAELLERYQEQANKEYKIKE